MSKEIIQPPANYRLVLENMINNNIQDLALEHIKKWGLKLAIKDGQLVEVGESTDAWLSAFITQDPKMLLMKDKVRALSKIHEDVLITGATGTGKELIARAIHGESEGEFMAVNCAGLPENLIESELFGHVQGAFTGATKTKQGLMKQAGKGTMFLDEIGELKLEVQAKLLRAIQERTIRKVGDDKIEAIECRIVCATNKNIEDLAEKNLFRLDLYARISTFEIDIIPLSDRHNDIPIILESLDGGKEFLQALLDKHGDWWKPIYDKLTLNVRSLQRMVKRYKVWKELP